MASGFLSERNYTVADFIFLHKVRIFNFAVGLDRN